MDKKLNSTLAQNGKINGFDFSESNFNYSE